MLNFYKKCFILFCLFTLKGLGQPEAYNWYFGIEAALNFSTQPPVALSNSTLQSSEGSASISDRNGNLLFYTDGATVYNRSHLVMANGTGLMGFESTSQSAVVVKKPGGANLYYLFTLGDGGLAAFGYSVIDMNLAAGMGSVTVKNVMLSNNCTEKLAAVRHCNGVDAWVVVCRVDNTYQFSAFKVDANGVNPVPVNSDSDDLMLYYAAQGCMKISPNGKKIGLACWPKGINIFDFDNATGAVSNPLYLYEADPPYTYAYGCEFSPDGTKFYSSLDSSLVQLDLCAGSNEAIIASQTTVGAVSIPPTNMYFASMQLGSDRKIYIAAVSGIKLAVINNPNITGVACNFTPNGPALAPLTYHFWGLPNFVSSYFKQTPSPFTYTTGLMSCKSMSFSSSPSPSLSSSCYATSNSYTSFKWVFGDPSSGLANISTQSNPYHIFSNTGLYKVTQILYSACGSDTISQSIAVGCTSISSENLEDRGIHLFPNPLNELLTVEVIREGSINLFDLNGKLVLKSKIVSGSNQINVSDLKPGLYSMQGSDEEGIWRTKLVKME